MAKKTVEIRDFVIVNVEKHPKDIAAVAAKEFGVTRQAINKHIRSLIAQGILSEEGSTRAKIYKLFRHELLNKTYKIGSALAEDQVYSLDVVPKLKDTGIGQNLSERCHYCFTEIFNNAIEHSEGTIITLNIDFDERNIYIIIDDNGVGIFKKIMKKFDLEDERVAIFELSKGKLTTEPAKHTGEGIFFSSRISDRFHINSHRLDFFSKGGYDVQFESAKEKDGTVVLMSFLRNSERTSKEVFDEFSSGNDYGFTITHVPVQLALVGEENLISRSQAKRLLARLDKFKEVALDFTGVKMIGQSFADEIFRVFQNEHPDIHIWYFNANEEVTQMISRAQFAKSQGKEG